MNIKLRNEIASHIFQNFGVQSSSFINLEKSKLLINQEFKLNDSLKLNVDDEIITYNIYGCQFSAEQQELKVILTKINNENILITQLKDSPFYGIYIENYSNITRSFISCSLDGKSWLECNTYLQSMLLSGLESIKENGLSFSKCTNCKLQIDALKSYISYLDEKAQEEN